MRNSGLCHKWCKKMSDTKLRNLNIPFNWDRHFLTRSWERFVWGMSLALRISKTTAVQLTCDVTHSEYLRSVYAQLSIPAFVHKHVPPKHSKQYTSLGFGSQLERIWWNKINLFQRCDTVKMFTHISFVNCHRKCFIKV